MKKKVPASKQEQKKRKIIKVQQSTFDDEVENLYQEIVKIYDHCQENSIDKKKLKKNWTNRFMDLFEFGKDSELVKLFFATNLNIDGISKLIELFDNRRDGKKAELHYIEYPEKSDQNPELKHRYYQQVQVEALYKFYKSNLLAFDVEDEALSENSLTAKQQVLIIHYLSTHGVLSINKIHQDITKQYKLLSALLKTGSNFYDYLREVGNPVYEEKYYTQENLKKILPLFEETDLQDVVKDIKARLD